MGIVFLIIFTLAEIALVVLTFTKFREKAKWMRNRAAIRAAETVLLLGIVLVPAVHMKWRFFLALGVLLIRLLIAGIVWMARRKKSDGLRKKPHTVVSCILSVILLALALVPTFLFANYNGMPVTGQYEVKEVSAVLVDRDREDPFENDGSPREVPAHFYYPENAEGSFPLVIFSHGAFGYYQSNFSTYAELVSNGYVVVALDHPHHSFFTGKADGSMVTVDSKFIDEAMTVGDGEGISYEEIYEITKDWTKLRADDESFVLDSINKAKADGALTDAWHTDNDTLVLSVLNMAKTDKIGAIGHSLGGAAAIALGRERNDIGAVIDLDGTALGEATGASDDKFIGNPTPYPVPVLVLSHGGNDKLTEDMVKNAVNGEIISCEGANHMDFTDLSQLSPFISTMLSGSSTVDRGDFLKNINAIVLNRFDFYLKNKGTLKEFAF